MQENEEGICPVSFENKQIKNKVRKMSKCKRQKFDCKDYFIIYAVKTSFLSSLCKTFTIMCISPSLARFLQA